jgi:hypothetical protein
MKGRRHELRWLENDLRELKVNIRKEKGKQKRVYGVKKTEMVGGPQIRGVNRSSSGAG